MDYDPKLKECLARIELLCAQYDCGGYVSLISKTHGEFRPVFPTWTGLEKEGIGPDGLAGVRLRCKKEEMEKAGLTAFFIHSSRDTAAVAFDLWDGLVKQTETKWQTTHESFKGFRPHREEEN